jgi:SAM-dependent methyltransferase
VATLPLFALDDPVLDTVLEVTAQSTRKRHGVHYTPAELASFMARRAIRLLGEAPVSVIDPACGDGELLLAVAQETQKLGWQVPALFGVDRDTEALALASHRLANFAPSGVALHAGDFLALGGCVPGEFPESYDLVISNPPYVRTQVLGATRAQALGRQFGPERVPVRCGPRRRGRRLGDSVNAGPRLSGDTQAGLRVCSDPVDGTASLTRRELEVLSASRRACSTGRRTRSALMPPAPFLART